MNNATAVVLITLGTLNLAATSAMLIGMVKGKKQMEQKITEVQIKANTNVSKLKKALLDLDL